VIPSDLSSLDPRVTLLDIDRADFEESLYQFYKAAWRFIDPARWMDSWAIDAICEHLQAVVDGQITKLIINCPPRIGKSSLTSVAFPAWTWAQPNLTHTSGAGVPFLYASYSDKLSLRDSVKCRRLIESPWYSSLWSSRFQLVTDNNTKSRFSNDRGGERLITSIGSGVTGEGGNIICVDDPNAANEIESEATTETTLDWWKTTLPTRANSQELSAIVIIQQRLAENDLTGHILETEADGWCHLCLPARYEPERAFSTLIGWKDPRTEPNQLLWPERLSDDALIRLEKRMGPYIFAGQMQQRPEPAGGGIIKREYWQLWPNKIYPKTISFVLACLDTAYTAEALNDPSGMALWGVFTASVLDEAPSRVIRATGRGTGIGNAPLSDMPDRLDNKYDPLGTYDPRGVPKVLLMHSWEERLELHQLVLKVGETCKKWQVDLLLIENKASGISVAQEMRRLFGSSGFGVQLFDPKSQDKVARLISVQHLFAEGLIYAPSEQYPWVEKFIKQVSMFPKGAHDEFVDLTSMGLRYLRDNGLILRAPEYEAEQKERSIYRGREEPLYSV
jgi:predicted phage terminase large subunit-like protein